MARVRYVDDDYWLELLEGHARLTAYMLARDQVPPELEVLVGCSPAITRWDCW